MGLSGASSHAASELMQLRQSEPLRMLNHHDGGIWDVDSNFYYGRRDQNMRLFILELIHYGRFFIGFHLTVKEGDFELREDLLLKPLRFRNCGFEMGKSFG